LKNHHGFTDDIVARFHETARGRNFSKEAVETKGPVIFEKSSASPASPEEESRNPLVEAGYRSIISVPLQSKNKIVGVFTLASRAPHTFTAQDLQLLISIGNQIGTAVENAFLYEKEQESVEKLMEMDRIKSEFLSNISHELRIPLTSIIGFSELILDKLTGPLNEEQVSYIKNMNTSGHHLLEIINNLLDLSKIKAGKMETHPHLFSLRTLLETIQQTIIPMTYKKGLRFELWVEEGIDQIYTDEGKLKQILLNVLGNAVKFTPENGDITLHARKSGLREANALEITVQDTGIGIPENAIGKIFDEFQQVDGSYTRDYPGTGLGLAITKRFVEILGGEISVKSRVGAGSAFTLLIPVAAPAAQTALLPERFSPEPGVQEPPRLMTPSHAASHPALRAMGKEDRPQILVVEDDPAVAKLLALYLIQEGYAVAHAYDGEEAI
ncbi:MAG TPA: ATP-binding protein, partial [Candidatus Manganitrophaceae bacterium]